MKSLRFDCATGLTTLVDVDPPEVAIPESVSPLQFRQALRAGNLKGKFEAHVARQSEALQEQWQHGREVRRSDDLVKSAVTSGGLTQAQADALFVDAQNYRA